MNLSAKNLFDTALIMLIPVIAGFYGAKRGYFSDRFSKKLSAFVLNIAQPFMIITSILATPYSDENLKSGFTVLLAAVVVHIVAAGVALLATIGIKDQKERRISEFCIMFANCGFFGFPLLQAVYGDIGVFWGGFFIVIFNFAIWTYGIFILSRANRELKIKITKIFINSGTIPCVIGFLLFILRINFYPPIYNSMAVLGNTCTPLSMAIIGAMLAEIPLKNLLTKPTTYYVSLMKLIVLPMLCGVVLRLIGFSQDISVFGALMTSLPSATASAMFAETYDIKSDLAAQTVGISTVLSILTVPLIIPIVEILLMFFN